MTNSDYTRARSWQLVASTKTRFVWRTVEFESFNGGRDFLPIAATDPVWVISDSAGAVLRSWEGKYERLPTQFVKLIAHFEQVSVLNAYSRVPSFKDTVMALDDGDDIIPF